MPISPLNVAFSSSFQLSVLFPVYREQSREKYTFSLNETASLTDHVFKDKHDLFAALDEKLLPTRAVYPVLPSTEAIIASYRAMIEQHIERRVAVFFQQLIACYQTRLHFEMCEAQDQGDSPDKVSLVDLDKQSIEFQRNAAHSSTLPCLIAYDPTEWAAYQAKKIPEPTGFVFLKGTDAYRLWNSTLNMPRWVNNADISIDGTTKNVQLRVQALALLNRAAQGEVTPDQALETFIDLCLRQIEASLKAVKLKGKREEERVLHSYREVLEEMQEELTTEGEKRLEDLLNITLDPEATDATCRAIIYKIRYRAIRDSQLGQAELIHKINQVRKAILGHKTKPLYFEGVFRTLLIEQARTKEDRQRLEKLYNFSPHDYQLRITASRQSRLAKTKQELTDKHLKKIQELASEVLRGVRSLRTAEEHNSPYAKA